MSIEAPKYTYLLLPNYLCIQVQSSNIWTYENGIAWLPKLLNIYTYHRPNVCTCVLISNMWISTYVCIGACWRQNMWHSSIWSTRNVSLGACDHLSMWVSKHSSMWAWNDDIKGTVFHVHMWQAKQEHVTLRANMPVYQKKSKHVCEHVIIKASKYMSMSTHKYVGMWYLKLVEIEA